MALFEYNECSDYWFLAYHTRGIPGSIDNTVIDESPFDWLLEGDRALLYTIVFFCRIKQGRYEELFQAFKDLGFV